jgi:type I restriction enzyme S subunit
VISDTFLEQFASKYRWNTAPTKRRFRFRKNVNKGMRETHRMALTMRGVIDRSLDDLEGLQASDYSTYQIFERGDLVFKLIDLENIKTSRVGLVPHRGIMSSAYIRLIPTSPDTDSRFYSWFFFAVYFNNIFNGMGGGVRQNLTPTDLLEFPIPLPDLPTQRAIADFLDRETARIDSLIEKKQRLVELLGEKWDSVVENAISAGGKRTKLGRHIDILSGFAFPSSDFSTDADDIPLLRGANVSPGGVRWDDTVYWARERLLEVSRFLLGAGDIVLGMDRPWISSGIRIAELTEQDAPALLLQRVCRIKPRTTMDKQFMKLLLTSRQFLAYFEPIMTGVSVPHISPDQVSSFSFEYVEPDEQIRRATVAGRERERIIRVQKWTETSIDRLKEYRSALITSAVTGQIDVSTYAKSGTTDRQLDAIQSEMQA